MAKEINIIMIKDNLSNIEVLKLIKSSIDTESLNHNPKGVKALKDLYDKVIKESLLWNYTSVYII